MRINVSLWRQMRRFLKPGTNYLLLVRKCKTKGKRMGCGSQSLHGDDSSPGGVWRRWATQGHALWQHELMLTWCYCSPSRSPVSVSISSRWTAASTAAGQEGGREDSAVKGRGQHCRCQVADILDNFNSISHLLFRRGCLKNCCQGYQPRVFSILVSGRGEAVS